MENIFEQIMSDTTQKKQVISLAKKLSKKFSVNSFNNLGDLQELAYWLFVFSKNELSEQVCNVIAKEQFKNVTLWAPVEYVKSLKCKFLLEKGKIEEAKTIIDEITAVNKNSNGFIRRLNGSLLPMNEINSALEDNDVKMAVSYTFSQISDLMFIKIMGGSETISKEKAQEMIDNSIDFILKNIK